MKKIIDISLVVMALIALYIYGYFAAIRNAKLNQWLDDPFSDTRTVKLFRSIYTPVTHLDERIIEAHLLRKHFRGIWVNSEGIECMSLSSDGFCEFEFGPFIGKGKGGVNDSKRFSLDFLHEDFDRNLSMSLGDKNAPDLRVTISGTHDGQEFVFYQADVHRKA